MASAVVATQTTMRTIFGDTTVEATADGYQLVTTNPTAVLKIARNSVPHGFPNSRNPWLEP